MPGQGIDVQIAIVDDRPLALEAIRRVVSRVPGYQVIWTAKDGEDAVRRAKVNRPDLILMDLIMPGINGAEATRRIMKETPCAILIVTATVSGNYGLVYEALGAGAVDAVNTPSLGLDGSLQGGDALLAKIAQIRKKLRFASGQKYETSPPLGVPVPPPIVAIGSSTGGPQALADLIDQLPADFPGAILIVQHLDAEFYGGLVEWLAPKAKIPVRVARAGERPVPGTVLIAGRDEHLIMRPDGSLTYSSTPVETAFRPSVDVLFESLAQHHPRPGVAVILTGMARDGAEGLLKLRKVGWQTYAQDKASCAVFGMPDAAIKLGAAVHVMPPIDIGRSIAAHIRAKHPSP